MFSCISHIINANRYIPEFFSSFRPIGPWWLTVHHFFFSTFFWLCRLSFFFIFFGGVPLALSEPREFRDDILLGFKLESEARRNYSSVCISLETAWCDISWVYPMAMWENSFVTSTECFVNSCVSTTADCTRVLVWLTACDVISMVCPTACPVTSIVLSTAYVVASMVFSTACYETSIVLSITTDAVWRVVCKACLEASAVAVIVNKAMSFVFLTNLLRFFGRTGEMFESFSLRNSSRFERWKARSFSKCLKYRSCWDCE